MNSIPDGFDMSQPNRATRRMKPRLLRDVYRAGECSRCIPLRRDTARSGQWSRYGSHRQASRRFLRSPSARLSRHPAAAVRPRCARGQRCTRPEANESNPDRYRSIPCGLQFVRQASFFPKPEFPTISVLSRFIWTPVSWERSGRSRCMCASLATAPVPTVPDRRRAAADCAAKRAPTDEPPVARAAVSAIRRDADRYTRRCPATACRPRCAR